MNAKLGFKNLFTRCVLALCISLTTTPVYSQVGATRLVDQMEKFNKNLENLNNRTGLMTNEIAKINALLLIFLPQIIDSAEGTRLLLEGKIPELLASWNHTNALVEGLGPDFLERWNYTNNLVGDLAPNFLEQWQKSNELIVEYGDTVATTWNETNTLIDEHATIIEGKATPSYLALLGAAFGGAATGAAVLIVGAYKATKFAISYSWQKHHKTVAAVTEV